MHDTVLGYTGAYRDAVTGGCQLGNGYRVYLPSLMRFSAPDSWSPFGVGGINPYAYCGGDPINRSDPSGHAFGLLEEYATRVADDAIEQGVRDASALAARNAHAAASETSSVEGVRSATLHRTRSESVSSVSSDSSASTRFSLHLSSESEDETWKDVMDEDGVAYVHGSNSASLEGVAKFRALLSMEKIHDTPWFFRDGSVLPSGDRFYTIEGLKTGHEFSKGISMNLTENAYLSVKKYSNFGTSGSIFPLLYGLDKDFEVSDDFIHPLSKESINIDHIRAIYVPHDRVDEAKRLLLDYGSKKLSSRVRGSTIFGGF